MIFAIEKILALLSPAIIAFAYWYFSPEQIEARKREKELRRRERNRSTEAE